MARNEQGSDLDKGGVGREGAGAAARLLPAHQRLRAPAVGGEDASGAAFECLERLVVAPVRRFAAGGCPLPRGCGVLLIYSARLGAGAKFQIGSQDTWDRVSDAFRKAIPAAESAKVILTPENVWNKFLLSPLEMRAFVDQFRSPWLQTHFDIGNVMQYGYPQDWILTLGSRIKRVHVKDYKLSTRAGQGGFVGLLEGDVDWKAVMAAFVKVDYRGYLSPEIGHDKNDPDQLKKVSLALDKILAMA